jgi:hypothetical protein
LYRVITVSQVNVHKDIPQVILKRKKMHSASLFIDISIKFIQNRNGNSVNFHMLNAICNKKTLEKFVLSALIRKHIKNTRRSISAEKIEEINCKTLSRA